MNANIKPDFRCLKHHGSKRFAKVSPNEKRLIHVRKWKF